MLKKITLLLLVMFFISSCTPPSATSDALMLETLQAENRYLRSTSTAAAAAFSATLAALPYLNAKTPTTISPTSVIVPSISPTLTPQAANLELIDAIFIVDDERTVVLTRIRNNNTFPVQMTPYQIGLYDKTEALVQAATGTIDLILSKQTIILSDVLITPRKSQFAPKYYAIERVEVQLSSGQSLDVPFSSMDSAFVVTQTNYLRDDYFPKVTGVITSNVNDELHSIPVIAVIYDEEGAIIGGGMGYIPFLPPKGSAPVEVSVVVSKYLSGRAELQPRLSLISIMHIHQSAN